jgi:hypothetical protein
MPRDRPSPLDVPQDIGERPTGFPLALEFVVRRLKSLPQAAAAAV